MIKKDIYFYTLNNARKLCSKFGVSWETFETAKQENTLPVIKRNNVTKYLKTNDLIEFIKKKNPNVNVEALTKYATTSLFDD